MECLLPYTYVCMVTVPHTMVRLERMLDYRGVGLARFHCSENLYNQDQDGRSSILHSLLWLAQDFLDGALLICNLSNTLLLISIGKNGIYILFNVVWCHGYISMDVTFLL